MLGLSVKFFFYLTWLISSELCIYNNKNTFTAPKKKALPFYIKQTLPHPSVSFWSAKETNTWFLIIFFFQFTCLLEHHCPFGIFSWTFVYRNSLCLWLNLYCFRERSNLLQLAAQEYHHLATTLKPLSVKRWQLNAKDKTCQSDRNFPTASSGQCHLSYFQFPDVTPWAEVIWEQWTKGSG